MSEPSLNGYNPVNGSSSKWHFPSIVVAVVLSVVSGAAVQAVVVIRWTGAIDVKMAQLEQFDRDRDTKLSQIDIQGSRNIPILQEKINGLEKVNDVKATRLNAISSRLDGFIQQVNRLDTPLSKKVEGIESVVINLRDSHGKDLVDIRNRLGILDGQVKALQDINDGRLAIIQRIEKTFEDVVSLKDRLSMMREGIDKDVLRTKEDIKRLDDKLDRLEINTKK